MKSGTKTGTKKKELKKLQKGERSSSKTVKGVKERSKIDNDFHHVHPFKEQ